MAKIKYLDAGDGAVCVIRCPGCGYRHRFAVAGSGATWYWDEDRVRPSVTPSIHIMPGSEAECHFRVEDGKISYLLSCHHDLADQTVELPEI